MNPSELAEMGPFERAALFKACATTLLALFCFGCEMPPRIGVEGRPSPSLAAMMGTKAAQTVQVAKAAEKLALRCQGASSS